MNGTATDSDLRVMIVDDEVDMRLLVRLTLEASRNGSAFATQMFDDGDSALEAWTANHAAQDTPDVVLLDNRMPRMSGLEFAAAVRETGAHQPIVMFSAQVDDKLCQKAATIGIDKVVCKTELSHIAEILTATARQAPAA